MKKIIYAVATATIFSSAIGVASAYDYNKTAKQAAKSAACACTECSCADCTCTDCSNCNCDEGCCSGEDCCGTGECSKK